MFLGNALYAGWIWKGDVLIADLEELETMDASEIYSKRLNAKEMIFPKQGEFICPIADGRIKTPGGDQELRTSTLVRPRPIQGDNHVDFLGESEGSLPQPHDSLLDAGEAMNDFWFMSGSFKNRHHVEPRVARYSPREESFPIPLKYIDVTRTTHTNLDVKQEKRIDDLWNIGGSRHLSDPWTGFTQFTLLDEKAPDGYTWSLTMHENCVEFISSTPRIRNSRKPWRTRVKSWKHQLLLLCPVKLWRIVGVVDSDKKKTKLACYLEANETTNACGKLDTIKSRRPYCRKRWEFITALQPGSQINSYASSYENSGSESSSGQGMGKIGENFGVELYESPK